MGSLSREPSGPRDCRPTIRVGGCQAGSAPEHTRRPPSGAMLAEPVLSGLLRSPEPKVEAGFCRIPVCLGRGSGEGSGPSLAFMGEAGDRESRPWQGLLSTLPTLPPPIPLSHPCCSPCPGLLVGVKSISGISGKHLRSSWRLAPPQPLVVPQTSSHGDSSPQTHVGPPR